VRVAQYTGLIVKHQVDVEMIRATSISRRHSLDSHGDNGERGNVHTAARFTLSPYYSLDDISANSGKLTAYTNQESTVTSNHVITE
jgi:hypothetical protein